MAILWVWLGTAVLFHAALLFGGQGSYNFNNGPERKFGPVSWIPVALAWPLVILVAAFDWRERRKSATPS